MFRNFIKITLRNLLKYKTFSIVNLLGLTVGLTSFLLIALWIRDEQSYDRLHVFSDRLYRVMLNSTFSDGSIETQDAAPALLSQVLKEEVPEIQYAISMDSWINTLVSYENQSVKEEGRYVGEDFLKMFSFPLLKGNKETALAAPHSIVISKRLADKLFAGMEPMGKAVKIGDYSEYQVTGVMENLPANTVFNFEFLMPLQDFIQNNAWTQGWENNGLVTWVMLRQGADVQAVNAKIKDVVRNHGPQDNADLFLQPLTDVYLKTDYKNGVYAGGGRMEYVRLFGIVAALLLLIACINFMNLSTARAAVRAREVGVRKVVGAGRRMLAVQFIGEAVLLCALAATLSLVAVYYILPWFNNFTDKQVTLPLSDTSTWGALCGIVLLTGLLAGSYPAFVLSSFRPVAVLKGQAEKIQKGVLLRKALVVAQFAIAVFLIASVVVIGQQLKFLQNKNLGYAKEHLLYMTLNAQMQPKFKTIKDEVQQLPGVLSVAGSQSRLTGYGNSSNAFEWEGKNPDDDQMFVFQTVTPGYVNTIGATLLEGRDFSEEFGADTANFVLNESAVKQMGLKPPYTGQQISAWGNPGRIVGVVRDFNFFNLKYPLQPLILIMSNPYVWTMNIRLDGAHTPETLRRLEQIARKYSPAFPFEYDFADEAWSKLYKTEQRISRLSSIFAFLAIFISCLGLFGLATFTAERRVKEIGVRKVLGASVAGIVGLMSKDFLQPVLLALALASPLAWYFMRDWLSDFAYHVEIRWWIFALTGLLAIGVALITVSYQSVRVALTNPVKSLRNE